jgi:hypothetical protein
VLGVPWGFLTYDPGNRLEILIQPKFLNPTSQ